MTEIEAIMEAHSGDKAIRVLYSAYRSILHVIRAEAAWVRQMDVGLEHEVLCLESQARSAEQTYARMMRERIKAEG